LGKKKEENDHVLQWAKTCVTKAGDRKTSYSRCRRAVPYSGHALTKGHKSKKDVLHCTAFLRVSEERRGIAVAYCDKHIGHAEDPALLSIDKESESYIVTLLNEGFTSNEILRKIGRKIAARNNVVPGRKHAFDIQSVEMRVNEASEEDGIRRYIPAIDETGDVFLLGAATLPVHTKLMESLYLMMTEEEVFKLFSEIKEVAPDFNPKLFMTDDTNSFYNGFQRAFAHAAMVKLLCCFHVLQAIKRLQS
ncbi:hypothetical protein GCK32_011419, partial [Trichostrongylus colubriformis]